MLMMRFLPWLLFVISRHARAILLRQESSLDSSRWNQGHKADANQLIQVSIALKIPNADLGVETLLRISDPASPDYGQHLSAKEVAHMFEPKPNAISGVIKWLRESGIDRSHIKMSHGGDHLSLNLSIQEATLLLETTFYHQTHEETGQEQIACQHYHIPESLAGSIDYILATSPVLTHQQIPRQQVLLNDKFSALAPLPLNCFKETTLSCLRNMYRIPDDFSWLPEDLDKFFEWMQKNLVSHRPKVDAVNRGYLQKNLTRWIWNQEPNLDFEYTIALTSPQEVTNVQVGSYEQVGNLDNILAAFDKYYCDSVNSGYKRYPKFYPPGCNTTTCNCGSSSPPKVLSISWGWTEASFTSNYLQRQCLEFLKLGLMGTTVVVSVSDHSTASGGGSFCIDDTTGNSTGERFSPTFPSSCPWVTSVGGTQMLQPTHLQIPAATINETAFRKAISGQIASSGGGFSNVFLAPPYQVPNVALYKDIEKDHLDKIQDRFSSTSRGYPDVAARADNYIVATNGKWKHVSSTSASNPVFASIITLINSERMHASKGSVGFINPVLYSNPNMLNNVVTGANQGCGVDQAFRATRGWDAVTGLGSPDYERMQRLFISLP